MTLFLTILVYTLGGTIVGSFISFLPSLHIYNVAGIALLIWGSMADILPEIAMIPFFTSLIVAFAFLNSIPMTLFSAADESASAIILPGTKNLLLGKGYETVIMSGIGSLVGVLFLVVGTPFFYKIMPYINNIVRPNLAWILLTVVAYMLMSEWPKGAGYGKTVWQKFSGAWANLFAGIASFLLAGLLGILIISKSIVTHQMAFQNIMPVFIGLFAIPSMIQNLLITYKIPKQFVPKETIDLDGKTLVLSSYQGCISGFISGYVPLITAGIGGIIAGAATALRGDKIFIIGGGVAKVIYYVGSFLFLFVITGLSPYGFAKGGLNIILKPYFSPQDNDYFLILSIIVLSGCVSFLMLMWLAKVAVKVLQKINFKLMYVVMLVLIVIFIYSLTGLNGIFVMIVSTCIGTIPVFYHCRRSNLMAVLLFPIILNMAGYGEKIADFLGLIKF
ncbi:MAG: Tripartite tricarboxylate transporter TctA family protein [Elusimicrobia bacterium ADurb.Bin231]|nr:MAG: Tripartite tricarboxylate transporter TctA family protein [Elusimicrobia bacterium ADurb.Bin231]